jgi:hypothetical protein
LLIVVAIALTASAPVRSRAEDEPQAKPPAAANEKAPPPSVTIIGPKDAHGVLGRDVRSPTNEDMGHIVDVIVDRTGTVRAAVIDFGGFLGVGSRKIAVQWSALHFAPADQKHPIVLELTPDQIKAAPEYSPSQEAAPVVTPTTPVPAHPPPSQAPPAPATASPPSAPEAPAAQDTQPQVSPQPTSPEPEAKPDPADKPAAR